MSVAPSSPFTTGRESIASYRTYEEAQRAVDYLSDHGFPVAGTLIVGGGLRSVERVVSRMTTARAAAYGAASGAWFGLLVGLFVGVFAPTAWHMLTLVLWGLLWGAVAGAVYGLISHAVQGGRRDFVSESGLVADKYEVLVESEHAPRARELLAKLNG
ncbi:general stress protein [Thermoactinospora rubra]|uniref:general stress protein n=1 Tax=Thermoactinospora rubra TaxID=1088767 RepID=UPI000A0F6814|nr:general stress protein [Thermoactinospora rubra]